MSPFALTGRVALVTGGNGGIGLGMAHGLAEAGAAIAIAGRNRAKSEAAAGELAKRGVETAVLQVDVADEISCRAMVDGAVERLGRLDILINNAGINIRKPPQDLAVSEWRQVIDTNLTGAFAAAHAAYPHMQRLGGGKIINIGSMMSMFGAAFASAYAASKGGIVQMTRALATAWAKDNIQINAVLPGWIDTDLTRRAGVRISTTLLRPETSSRARRWGEPGDMAGIAVFLASQASNFVTGAAIPVDGGYSAQG